MRQGCIEAGKPNPKPTMRKHQLEDELAALTQALGEAAVEIRGSCSSDHIQPSRSGVVRDGSMRA